MATADSAGTARRRSSPATGGATTIREFLDADVVDTLQVAVSPKVELGSGSRLWESPDELNDRFHHDVVPSPSGVVHHLFWRR
jgi:dihydrofolate reductase